MSKAQNAAVAAQRENLSKAGEPLHAVPWDFSANFFGTTVPKGLTASEAEARLTRFGANELFGNTGPSALKILLTNLFNPMNAVLMIAMIFSVVVYDYVG
jgi:magnesium-transporting ATPase (P-type)